MFDGLVLCCLVGKCSDNICQSQTASFTDSTDAFCKRPRCLIINWLCGMMFNDESLFCLWLNQWVKVWNIIGLNFIEKFEMRIWNQWQSHTLTNLPSETTSLTLEFDHA